jgi:hypothetical protein
LCLIGFGRVRRYVADPSGLGSAWPSTGIHPRTDRTGRAGWWDGQQHSRPGCSARDFVRAITQAVDTTISDNDVATYDRAVARLTTQPAAGRVLGDMLRSLLEDTHPNGFDSDDIALVVGRCYRAAVAWLPPERVDLTTLLAALGIHEPGITYQALNLPRAITDEYRDPDGTVPVKPPAWPDYAWHAPLLVADLLPFAPATLGGHLESTFGEYRREAHEELP